MGRVLQVISCCLGICLLAVLPSMAEEISGRWNVVVELDIGDGSPLFIFEQNGEVLTGTYKGTFDETQVSGIIKGTKVEFWFELQGTMVTYVGTIDGDTMVGTCNYVDLGSGEWKAQRAES